MDQIRFVRIAMQFYKEILFGYEVVLLFYCGLNT